FLREHTFPEYKLQKVRACINATRYKHEPENSLEACMIDADRLGMGKINFTEAGERLRKVWEIYLDKEHGEAECMQIQENYLNETNFFTHYADKNYTPLKEKNATKIKKLKPKLDEKNGFTRRIGKRTIKRSKKVLRYIIQSASLGMLISFTLNFSFWDIDQHLVILSLISGIFIGIVLRNYDKQYTKVDDGSSFAVSMVIRTLAMGGLFLLSIVVSTGIYTIVLTKDEFAKVYDEKIECIFSTPEHGIRFF